MKNVIVCISGPARTGKDTLAKAIDEDLVEDGFTVQAISSIDAVKAFTREIIAPRIDHTFPDEPTQADRVMWAEIKAALDKGVDWTARYPFTMLDQIDHTPTALLYQVREINNIELIRKLGKERSVPVLWIHTDRRNMPRVPASMSDSYHAHEIIGADVLVMGTGIEEVPAWAALISAKVNKLSRS